MSEAGQRMVDSFDEHQNPIIECVNPGPPKSMLLPYPISFTRPDENTIVIERELMEEIRYVYLDRDHPIGEPSRIGHSIGWFEGDTLVVDTVGFVYDDWGNYRGLDSSEQKHVVERYTLTEGGYGLHMELTQYDPEFLDGPAVMEWNYTKKKDYDFEYVACSLDSARRHLEENE